MKQYKHTKTECYLTEFRQLKREINKQVKLAYGSYISKLTRGQNDLLVEPNSIAYSNVHFYNITEFKIIDASRTLKNKMTSGTDSSIISCFVKDSISVLAQHLKIIFNLGVETDNYPNLCCKKVKVCYVFENCDSINVSNYRHSSILCNFPKLFEVVLCNRIYMSLHNQISIHQHGFMTGRSPQTNLAILHNIYQIIFSYFLDS